MAETIRAGVRATGGNMSKVPGPLPRRPSGPRKPTRTHRPVRPRRFDRAVTGTAGVLVARTVTATRSRSRVESRDRRRSRVTERLRLPLYIFVGLECGVLGCVGGVAPFTSLLSTPRSCFKIVLAYAATCGLSKCGLGLRFRLSARLRFLLSFGSALASWLSARFSQKYSTRFQPRLLGHEVRMCTSCSSTRKAPLQSEV